MLDARLNKIDVIVSVKKTMLEGRRSGYLYVFRAQRLTQNTLSTTDRLFM